VNHIGQRMERLLDHHARTKMPIRAEGGWLDGAA
jgi:hypothetical protein